MNDKNKKPQMKAPRVTPLEGVYTYCFAIRGRGVENPQGFGIDKRRYVYAAGFGKRIHRKGRKEHKAMQQESLRSGMDDRYSINTELVRTDTNSRHSEFVRVRISSLLTSILSFSLRPLRSLRLNDFFAPAHGRAPPALHPRSSRAGG